MRFRRERIRALPSLGSIAEYAEVLSVSKMTVYRWIVNEGAPAVKKWVNEYAHYSISKPQFVQWLIESGRYKVKGEYE